MPQNLLEGCCIASWIEDEGDAHKRVVQARVEGAGMPWASSNVHAMLALRVMIDHQCWEKEWQARQDLHINLQHQRAYACQAG